MKDARDDGLDRADRRRNRRLEHRIAGLWLGRASEATDVIVFLFAHAPQRRPLGVGELDAQWYPLVQVTHEALVGYGIDSTFVQFDGEEHIVSPRFDETVFFDWWSSH